MQSAQIQTFDVGTIIDNTLKHDVRTRVIIEHSTQRAPAWNNKQWDSDFIMSILFGYPVPSLIFESVNDGYLVHDGKNRIVALCNFYKDEIRLKKYIHSSEYIGKTYSQLTPEQQRIFLQYKLSSWIFPTGVNQQILQNYLVTVNMHQKFYHDHEHEYDEDLKVKCEMLKQDNEALRASIIRVTDESTDLKRENRALNKKISDFTSSARFNLYFPDTRKK